MGILGDVIVRLRGVLEKCGQARADLNQAADLLDEANIQFAHAMDGAHDPGADETLGLLARVQADVTETCCVLVATGKRVQDYITRFGEATSAGEPVSLSDAPQPAPASVPPTWERIEQLRGQLPPPVVRNSGQKTHGRWIAPDGPGDAACHRRD